MATSTPAPSEAPPVVTVKTRPTVAAEVTVTELLPLVLAVHAVAADTPKRFRDGVMVTVPPGGTALVGLKVTMSEPVTASGGPRTRALDAPFPLIALIHVTLELVACCAVNNMQSSAPTQLRRTAVLVPRIT